MTRLSSTFTYNTVVDESAADDVDRENYGSISQPLEVWLKGTKTKT